MSIQLYFIILLFFLLGCQSKKKDFSTYNNEEVHILKGTILGQCDSILFSAPSQLKLYRGDIFIGDERAENECIYRFRLDNLEFIKGYGAKGKASNEYITFEKFDIRNDKIHLWDIASTKFLIYDIQDEKQVTVKKMKSTTPALSHATFISDSILAYSDLHTERFVTLQSTSGQLLDSISLQSKVNQDKEGLIAPGLLYAMKLSYYPETSTLIGTTRLGEVVMLYNTETKITEILVGPSGLPCYTIGSDFPTSDIILGFADHVQNEDRLYALYSGAKFQEGIKTGSSLAHTIHVFDIKNAKLLYSYHLDYNICAFDIDWDNNTLYAINANDHSLISFQLKQ